MSLFLDRISESLVIEELVVSSPIEYYQSKSIYGYPIVISVDKLNTPLPTTGGLVLMIDGLNYGTNNSQVVVEYVNEKGITYSPSCQLTINHTQLTCTTVPGYGNRLSWSIEVNGLLSVDLFVMSYAKPSIDSLTCKNMNCGRLTGGEVVILTGSNLGPSSSPVQATYGFSGLEFTARIVTSYPIQRLNVQLLLVLVRI